MISENPFWPKISYCSVILEEYQHMQIYSYSQLPGHLYRIVTEIKEKPQTNQPERQSLFSLVVAY